MKRWEKQKLSVIEVRVLCSKIQNNEVKVVAVNFFIMLLVI